MQIVLLGTGDADAERFFAWADAHHGDRFRAWLRFDNGRAHRIEAGADFFLMPSRFEPCGLNQMYSLRYGTLPIVRATGGLVDTVANYDEATGGGTGFMFDDLAPGVARQHDRLGGLDLVRPPRAHRRRCARAPWRRTSPGSAPPPRTATSTSAPTSAGAATRSSSAVSRRARRTRRYM